MPESALRQLTTHELSALPAGLKAALGHADICLIAAPHPLARIAGWIGWGSLILVRGRRIFWPGLPDDLSRRHEDVSLLAHELTHVWQYANGMTLWRYVWREIRRFPGVYSYRLIPGKAFQAYGYEQQAAMVEDWVRHRLGLPVRWARAPGDANGLAALIPFAQS
jgi:hypothetical protein